MDNEKELLDSVLTELQELKKNFAKLEAERDALQTQLADQDHAGRQHYLLYHLKKFMESIINADLRVNETTPVTMRYPDEFLQQVVEATSFQEVGKLLDTSHGVSMSAIIKMCGKAIPMYVMTFGSRTFDEHGEMIGDGNTPGNLTDLLRLLSQN
jgi:uncharacterized Fe-S cluster-containing radical SAM superfamily enzyme